jgi:hypothetical protein
LRRHGVVEIKIEKLGAYAHGSVTVVAEAKAVGVLPSRGHTHFNAHGSESEAKLRAAGVGAEREGEQE